MCDILWLVGCFLFGVVLGVAIWRQGYAAGRKAAYRDPGWEPE